MYRRRLLIGVASAMTVAGCTSGTDVEATESPTDTPRATPSPDPTPTPIEGLVSQSPHLRPVSVRDYQLSDPGGVRGVVENISGTALDYVEVTTYFYNDDTQVGNTLDNTDSLPPGKKWEFHTPYNGDQHWNQFVARADDKP